MIEAIRELIANVAVSEPVTVGRLQVFGLRWSPQSDLVYSVLDDALAAKTLEVTEVGRDGSVPTLLVTNRADSPVLLVAGEQLIGAKQDRVLNASMMVGGRSQVPIPVSCVEQGRWGYQSHVFRSGQSSSHSYLRAMMARNVLEGYRSEGKPSSKQIEVWAEVRRKLDAMGSRSPTSALAAAYENHSSKLNEIPREIRVPDDCSGVAFAFGDRLAGVDWFDKRETMTMLLPKLAKAYALDAFEEPETDKRLDRLTVQKWLRRAAMAAIERYDSPGIGDDIRIESDAVIGAGLLVGDQPVHVELFPNSPLSK